MRLEQGSTLHAADPGLRGIRGRGSIRKYFGQNEGWGRSVGGPRPPPRPAGTGTASFCFPLGASGVVFLQWMDAASSGPLLESFKKSQLPHVFNGNLVRPWCAKKQRQVVVNLVLRLRLPWRPFVWGSQGGCVTCFFPGQVRSARPCPVLALGDPFQSEKVRTNEETLSVGVGG